MTSYFPAEPARRALRRLAAERDNTIVDIAMAAGIDRCTLQRLFTRDRLRYDAADNIAVALGYHPCQLWPEWFPLTEARP
ncbi:MAG: Winged helix-turn-helix DNA-binding [Frankiaceae bacterium]|jgi:lambda repressor-like predicted transcriptional regulator|nr:Winged helix-turn-helix DNA-binding [Frankiaceae bacterium]